MSATTRPPAYRGSLDPIEDIAQALRDLGVVFTLTVQLSLEDRKAHSWHNLDEHGPEGIPAAESIHAELIAGERARRAKGDGA